MLPCMSHFSNILNMAFSIKGSHLYHGKTPAAFEIVNSFCSHLYFEETVTLM